MPFIPWVATIGNIAPPLPVASGGTGAATAAAGLASLGGLVNQATTGNAGVALINGTATILTWTTPNDGNMHRAMIFGEVGVTVAETGGQVTCIFTPPAGSAKTLSLQGGGAGTGTNTFSANLVNVAPNTTVTVNQATALTAGTATCWAEIWGL